MKDKLIIELEDWDHVYTWGIDVKVNGVKLKHDDDSIQSILQSVLEHLGYTVKIDR
jgi:hypothetical protein